MTAENYGFIGCVLVLFSLRGSVVSTDNTARGDLRIDPECYSSWRLSVASPFQIFINIGMALGNFAGDWRSLAADECRSSITDCDLRRDWLCD